MPITTTLDTESQTTAVLGDCHLMSVLWKMEGSWWKNGLMMEKNEAQDCEITEAEYSENDNCSTAEDDGILENYKAVHTYDNTGRHNPVNGNPDWLNT